MIFHTEAKIIIGETIITADNYSDQLLSLSSHNDLWIKDTAQFILDYLNSSPSISINSSGTTDVAKSFPINKSRMISSALMTGKFFSLTAGSVALLALPITYIAGKMMVVRALTLGLSLYIVKPSSDPFIDNHLPDNIDFAPFVPLQVQTILATELSSKKLNSVKIVLLGGAIIDSSLSERIKLQSNAYYESFGMTETLSHIALRKINGKSVNSGEFNALPDVSFTKDDRDCLVINAHLLLDSPLVSNDVVNLIDANTFIWLGRFDNVINSGGVKILPESLEKQLLDVIPVDFCIVSEPDERLGQKLVLVVEAMNISNIEVEKIFNAMKSKIEPYLIPKSVYCMPELLRNAHGKLLRHLIIANIITKSKNITKIYP